MKSGFVAIVGRPSAGKSTLLNALCGEKVAITSNVPQTTRNAIRGIVNREAGQLVFLDTPGYHQSDKKLNIYLKDVVHRSLDDADLVLYVVDASRTPGREEQALMELLKRSGRDVVVAVNKIDLNPPRLAEIRGLVAAHLKPRAIRNVSAESGSGVEALVDAILDASPEGEPHYPAEFYTDQDPEFRIAEIIREQAILRSEQEIPHALYVEIADMEFGHPGDDREDAPAAPDEAPAGAPEGFFDGEAAETPRNLWVRAFIVVERPSQVGIVVGRGGERVRAIRIASLKEMRRVFPWKIRLDLRVKTHPKWRRSDPLLKRMLGPGE